MMKRNYVYRVALFLILAGVVAGYFYLKSSDDLPEYIAVSNGRIEAQTVDVATRSGGRVLSVLVEEGQMVEAGEVVATLDLQHLAAALEGAKANVRSAIQQQEEAASRVKEVESALELARKEYARYSQLVKDGAISKSRNDQIFSQKQTAEASLEAAKQRLQASKGSVEAAEAEVKRQEELLSDQYLKAPRAGRVLYKLVEPGEVVPSGGKVVTLLDLTDVYMTVFYPMEIAGKLRLGDEARIVVDALPDVIIPASVSYVSPEAQFTPRQIETKSEREKMTFRVKVRIPAPLLKKHLDAVKTGLPGVAYVRTQKDAPWPAFLSVRPDLLADSKE
jgi:HlyD family secretion protein